MLACARPTDDDAQRGTMSGVECEWVKIEDEATGRAFYANRETNERTWNMPEAYRCARHAASTRPRLRFSLFLFFFFFFV